MTIRALAKRGVRELGFEVRRLDPAASLGLFLATLISDMEIGCVLDVGANEGQFGRSLRGDGYSGPLLSFEPVGAAFTKLQSAVGRDWRCYNYALGAEAGQFDINIPEGGTDVASFRQPEPGALEAIGATGSGSRTETARVARLDAVLPDLTDARRIFLKLDTQGFDLAVLEGAAGILDRVVAIQTELSFRPLYQGQPSWRESLDRLAELGFEPAGFYPIMRKKNWAIIEADCVLVRA